MRRLVLVLAVMGGLLAACAGVALAQAESETLVVRSPGVFEATNPCNGQTVTVEGTYTIVFHLTDDASGNDHNVAQVHFQGTAVDEDGTRYRVIHSTSEQYYSRPGEPGEFPAFFEFTGVQQHRFISEDGTDNFILSSTFHITEDADGQPTVLISHFDAKCTGSEE